MEQKVWGYARGRGRALLQRELCRENYFAEKIGAKKIGIATCVGYDSLFYNAYTTKLISKEQPARLFTTQSPIIKQGCTNDLCCRYHILLVF